MTVKYRICIYCDKWGSGGIESFLLNLLEHMNICLFEIDLVVSRIESEFYINRLEVLGVSLLVLSNSTSRLPKNRKLFRKLLKEQHYDIVYLNLFQALSLIYAKEAKRANVPLCIIHSHNNNLRKSFTKPLKLMLHFLAKHIYGGYGDLRFACSAQAGKFMFPFYRNWTWIPNGIDVSNFAFNSSMRAKLRKELNIEDRFVLGNIGRLCNQKNQTFLLDLVYALSKEREDVILLLVGEGEDQQVIKKKICSLYLERYVTLMGNRDDVSELYQAMDCFLLPSRFEGLGIVAVEAQAAGLPVLCAEGLPQEVRCSPNLHFLPINQGVGPWLSALSIPLERVQSAELVVKKGYDIYGIASAFENIWKSVDLNPKRKNKYEEDHSH